MCVCMCACVCTCVRVYVCVCTCVCVCVCECECVCKHTPSCVWGYVLKKELFSAYKSAFDRIFSVSIALSVNDCCIATEGLQFFGVICNKSYTENSLSKIRR
jgi:hypothetical protein